MHEIKFDPTKVEEVEFPPDISLNTEEEVVLEQVRQNIRRGLQQVIPFEVNTEIVALVCGGPSLKLPEIERKLVNAAWSGAKVVAVNGAYSWCIERNIRPTGMVMIDAREFNSRFVGPAVTNCKYFLASQCHPKAFELCRGRDVWLWHACSYGEKELAILDDYYLSPSPEEKDKLSHRHHFPITMGTTVAIRAIGVMRMLGFRRFKIFGLDSCWLGDDHHGYEQKENDGEVKYPIWVRPQGRDDLATRFICSAWQIKQAQDFLDLIREHGELFQLSVYGPGLIATMLRLGATMESEQSQP